MQKKLGQGPPPPEKNPPIKKMLNIIFVLQSLIKTGEKKLLQKFAFFLPTPLPQKDPPGGQEGGHKG